MDKKNADLSNYRLGELIDISAVQKMADSHFLATGIPVGLIDATDDSILVEAGWQDICVSYHRIHPETSKRCQESDNFIKKNLNKRGICEYRCLNGLWHIGIPICISEEHLGTLFLGQFFYEDKPPDHQFFYDQCKKYGFNWETYSAALAEVPILSREKIKDIVEYDIALARFISNLAEKSLHQKIGKKKLKNAFNALQESENKFRTVFENAAQGKTINSLDGQFLGVNEALCQLSGFTREELLAKKWQDLVHPEFIDKLDRQIQMLLKGEIQSFRQELKFTRKNGEELWSRNNIVLIRDSSGTPQFLFAEIEDITAQKKNELLLLESEEKYRMLFDGAEIMISIYDRKGRCLLMNQKLAAMFGSEPEKLIGRTFTELHPNMGHEYTLRIQKVIDQENLAEYEDLVSFPDGRKAWLLSKVHPVKDANGRIYAAQILSQDITEKKNLAHQLQQNQKMEALGTLAGGIAHDFNNMLSPILGFTELVKIRTAEDQKIQNMLNQILASGLRAKELVKHILTFSRKADAKNDVMQITPIIKENVKFLKASISPDIEIKCHYPQEDLTIYADLTQVHQVLMNLLTNAVHAMHENGGILDLKLGTEEINKADNRYSPELETAKYVKLEIKDTGHGISEKIIDRVFEPFFTTKPRGEGTGLGLSQAYGLVKEMGGHISVDSTKDIGTIFTLLIPVHDGAKSEYDDVLTTGLVKGRGKILIVDDEKSILDWTSKILLECGYTIVCASSGSEALAELTKAPDEIDLVITDLSMPKMTGLELANLMKDSNPDLPILLSTGFSETLTPAKLKENGIASLLMKPVIASELSQRVDFCLTRKNKGK